LPRHGRARCRETRQVDVADEGIGRLAGTAVGHQIRLAEDLKLADDLVKHDERERAMQAGQRDVAEDRPQPCPIEARRLIAFARNVLQAGKQDDHGEAEHPPDGRDDDARHRKVGVGHPYQRLRAEGLHDVADQPLIGAEHERPDQRDHRDRQHGRQIEQGA
jgi:hypothetical protein